jgi:hypothetical protein
MLCKSIISTYDFVDLASLNAKRNVEAVGAEHVPSIIDVLAQQSGVSRSALVGDTNVVDEDGNLDCVVRECGINGPTNNTISGQLFNDTTRVSHVKLHGIVQEASLTVENSVGDKVEHSRASNVDRNSEAVVTIDVKSSARDGEVNAGLTGCLESSVHVNFNWDSVRGTESIPSPTVDATQRIRF